MTPVGAESAERVRGGYSVESPWLAAAADDVLNLPAGEDTVGSSGSPCDEVGRRIGRLDADAAVVIAGNVGEHIADIFAEPVHVLAVEPAPACVGR